MNQENPQHQHISVLLEPAVQALNIQASGVYIDGTFGRGGHSRAILQALKKAESIGVQHTNPGQLLAFDKDLAAIDFAQQHFTGDNFSIIHDSFAQLNKHMQQRGIGGVDGILLDLGISSPQIDDGARGFSFMHNGPLDMRMNTLQARDARWYIQHLNQDELAHVLSTYGQERFAKKIAAAIKQHLQHKTIDDTQTLANIIAQHMPGHDKKHPATRTFQALRILVNQELQELEDFLSQFMGILNPGGRVVMMSFHSLEDTLVKKCFKKLAQAQGRHPIYSQQDGAILARYLGKVTPDDAELSQNPRARSVVMRILEKN